MRKTDINQVISYKDIKEGDKIRVSGELDVKSVRPGSVSPRLGRSTIATVAAPGDPTSDTSWAILESDTVTLLERDVEIEIPDDALIVMWQDTDDCDYYARKLDDGRWQDSDDQVHDSAEDLVEAIIDGEYDDYQIDTFEVIKRERSKYAQGGYVHGSAAAGKPHLHVGGAPSGVASQVTLSPRSVESLSTLARNLGMVR